jgi:hypothetical protein
VADLAYDADAAKALGRLERDPKRAAPLRAVSTVLDMLEADPGQAAVRRHRFSNGLRCVVIEGPDEDWAVLWEPHPEETDTVVVQYLGPASFA